jgi:predicted RNA binding protein YcfA (HicA-like mRNA interferase family)
MRLSRDESGSSLVKKFSKLGYILSRQKGSHITLTRTFEGQEYHITIPNHDPIKVGLLAKILNDVAQQLGISKEELNTFLNQ